jgi:hypothetical protein
MRRLVKFHRSVPAEPPSFCGGIEQLATSVWPTLDESLFLLARDPHAVDAAAFAADVGSVGGDLSRALKSLR